MVEQRETELSDYPSINSALQIFFEKYKDNQHLKRNWINSVKNGRIFILDEVIQLIALELEVDD